MDKTDVIVSEKTGEALSRIVESIKIKLKDSL